MCNCCIQELQQAARIAGNSKVMHAKIAYEANSKILARNYFRRLVVDGAKIIVCKNGTCNHSLMATHSQPEKLGTRERQQRQETVGIGQIQ